MTSPASVSPAPTRRRALIRDALVWLGVPLVAPLWLIANVERRCTRSEACFAACSELLSLVPGILGVYLRRSFYRMTLESYAMDCHLGFGTTLAHRDASFAPGVYVGSRCTIGSTIFETGATVGSNVDILSGRRQHGIARRGVTVQSQPGNYESVRIGRNSWVGNSSVIMADVGDDCVIGAGAVVVRPIEAGAVAVGNPAEIVRRRVA